MQEDCLFCQKYGRKPIDQISFAPLLNRALYTKYSQLKWQGRKYEDLYSTKPIKWVIEFKDSLLYQESDCFLKRFYPKSDQGQKFEQLLEYYKYHQDIPRMFLPRVSDVAIYFYEKKKQYEYRKIKHMLGIPIEDYSNCTGNNLSKLEYEKLEGELLVLNEMTQQTQVSSQSLLKELVKQNPETIVFIYNYKNIDASWLTMSQPQIKKSLAPNLKLLKQLITKNSKGNQQQKQKMPFSVYSQKSMSPTLQINLQALSKDCSYQKSIKTMKNVSDSKINEYQKFLKQQVVNLNHYSSAKQSTKGIQPSLFQSKQNSCHYIQSTRSISQEQLRLSQTKKPNHKKSQTHYTEISSPQKKDAKIQKMYTNMGSNDKNKQSEKLFKIYTSSSNIPVQANINININQLNMNNLNCKSPFQQYKAMLESPKSLKKKISESQRIISSAYSGNGSSHKKQISSTIIDKIKSQRRHK